LYGRRVFTAQWLVIIGRGVRKHNVDQWVFGKQSWLETHVCNSKIKIQQQWQFLCNGSYYAIESKVLGLLEGYIRVYR
jgi:hypothetical protein